MSSLLPKSLDPVRLDQLICVRCGVQYDEIDRKERTQCPICDDHREAVSGAGQIWTTLNEVYKAPPTSPPVGGNNDGTRRIEISEDPQDSSVVFLNTVPRAGIGQCPFIIKTPHGLVIWEVTSYIDQPTIDAVKAMGEVNGIAISHPHFYGPLFVWSEAFGNCPIYLPKIDKDWVQMKDKLNVIKFYDDEVEIVPGCKVIRLGGHFPGSAVLSVGEKLFVSDTLLMTPRAANHKPPSFAFQRSVTNWIPLPPSELIAMWRVVKKIKFNTAYGVKPVYPQLQIIRDSEMDERETNNGETVKYKILDSMRMHIRSMGHEITPEMELEM